LDVNGEPPWQSPTHLYAVAYRVVCRNGERSLESWRESLAVGACLPTLPLWLEPDLSVPLHLEESYQATCSSLRIRGREVGATGRELLTVPGVFARPRQTG